MDSQIIDRTLRAYRNDLRAELNAVAEAGRVVYQGREAEGRVLGHGDLYIPLPDDVQRKSGFLNVRLPRDVFDALVEHERRFGRTSRIAEADRVFSGVSMLNDASWPFCSECLLPFATLLNGHAGIGVWVERIEDSSPLCGSCWLASEYHNDLDRMVEHTLSALNPLQRAVIAFQLRRKENRRDVTYFAMPTFCRAPGLFELLRLHRVSLIKAAVVIVRHTLSLVDAVRSDEQSIDRFAARDSWRGEQCAA
jgi:hypothetical protein